MGAAQLRAALPDFVRLLQDAVAGGAALGFLGPLGDAEARAYWNGVFAGAERGECAVFAALEGNEVIGTAQLTFAGFPASRHRAEIEKVLVRSDVRRRGIARALIEEVERTAQARECSLLVLDAVRGSAAEAMYERLAYRRAGVIPQYARNAGGELVDAVILYKQLE